MAFFTLQLLITVAVSQTPVTVVDDLQRTVTLPQPGNRLVSLAPSITETLFAIGAEDLIVGVTDYCNFPPAAKQKPHVGGMVNPSIEAIVGLHPDLIVLSMEGNVREDFARLTSFGVPVFVTNPRTLAGIKHSIEQLGILTGRTAGAERLVKTFQAREDSIAANIRGPRVRTLCFVSLQPIMVVGQNTFLNELLERAGAENLASSAPGTYPAYSRENVLATNPDVMLILTDALTDVGQLVALFPEFRELSAVRKHHVFLIDADLVSRPGPRAVDGLHLLYHTLHEHGL